MKVLFAVVLSLFLVGCDDKDDNDSGGGVVPPKCAPGEVFGMGGCQNPDGNTLPIGNTP